MNGTGAIQLGGPKQSFLTGTSKDRGEIMAFYVPEVQNLHGSQQELDRWAQFAPRRRDCLIEEQELRTAVSMGSQTGGPKHDRSFRQNSSPPTYQSTQRKKVTYLCSVCGKMFKYLGNPVKHERAHTGEEQCMFGVQEYLRHKLSSSPPKQACKRGNQTLFLALAPDGGGKRIVWLLPPELHAHDF